MADRYCVLELMGAEVRPIQTKPWKHATGIGTVPIWFSATSRMAGTNAPAYTGDEEPEPLDNMPIKPISCLSCGTIGLPSKAVAYYW